MSAWICVHCTLKNHLKASECEACSNPRVLITTDWACNSCTLINVSTAEMCKVCLSPRSQIVSQENEKKYPVSDSATMDWKGSSPECRNIVLLGNTGCGKSTIANCLTKTKAFAQGAETKSITKVPQTAFFLNGTASVTDLPGWCDTDQEDEKNLRLSIEKMQEIQRIHLFVIVFNITVTRSSPAFCRALRRCNESLPGWFKQCLIIWNFKDDVGGDYSEEEEAILSEIRRNLPDSDMKFVSVNLSAKKNAGIDKLVDTIQRLDCRRYYDCKFARYVVPMKKIKIQKERREKIGELPRTPRRLTLSADAYANRKGPHHSRGTVTIPPDYKYVSHTVEQTAANGEGNTRQHCRHWVDGIGTNEIILNATANKKEWWDAGPGCWLGVKIDVVCEEIDPGYEDIYDDHYVYYEEMEVEDTLYS